MTDTPTPELWCVHVLGPDSIIAQPDYETAVRRAQEWVVMLVKIREQRGSHPYDPIVHCNVAPHTGSAERHAEQLAEHGGNPEDIC